MLSPLPAICLLLSLATTTTAITGHTLSFQNLFPEPRLLIFTPTPSSYIIPPQLIAPSQILSLSTPHWNGNFKAVNASTYNAENPGLENHIWGEVCFACWQDITFFDVSAIWNCCDNEGVHWMWGYDYDGDVDVEGDGEGIREGVREGEVSGCETFPCKTVYNKSGDMQTKTTTKNAIWVVLGS
ncbi:SchS21 protein [Sclerotinia borealis F-4128]|uniref:SchS21 protein n=1 Tax=Sclerotinia borealis (strain F-4128) TaxID=1432307 RepID=W9CG54_SCLBF|nr:SchS21 protein [Sclerotinia borealis F-4128]